MNAEQKIAEYLERRITHATAPEIAKATKIPIPTVRKILGSLITDREKQKVNCRVTHMRRTGYTMDPNALEA